MGGRFGALTHCARTYSRFCPAVLEGIEGYLGAVFCNGQAIDAKQFDLTALIGVNVHMYVCISRYNA